MDFISVGFTPVDEPLDGRYVSAKGLNGLLPGVISAVSDDDAVWFHDHPVPKPFSFIPFYDADDNLAGLRLAALTPRAAGVLLRGWRQAREQQTTLRLGKMRFQVRDVAWAPGPTYAELAATPARDLVGLAFRTPTAFRQRPDYLRLPLPRNVFMRPLEIWNTFATAEDPRLQLGDAWLEWCAERVFVADCRLEIGSALLYRKGRNRQTFSGFVGEVVFQAVDEAPRQQGILQALARLAAYCGVGHRATMGMGAVELLDVGA